MANEPAPGWYNDPKDPSQLRWWDGATWGEMTQAKSSQPGPSPQAPAAYGGFAPGQAVPLGGGLLGEIEQVIPKAGMGGGEGGLQQAEGFYHQHRTGIDTIAGAALVTDGLIGDPLRPNQLGGISGAVLGLLIGLLFAGIGFFLEFSLDATPSQMSATVVGTVTNAGMSREAGAHGTSVTTCNPVVAYSVNGQQYQQTRGYGSSDCSGVGSPVTVYYDPSVPSSSKLQPPGSLGWGGWVFVAVGLLVALGSLFSLIKSVFLVGAGGALLAKSVVDREKRR